MPPSSPYQREIDQAYFDADFTLDDRIKVLDAKIRELTRKYGGRELTQGELNQWQKEVDRLGRLWAVSPRPTQLTGQAHKAYLDAVAEQFEDQLPEIERHSQYITSGLRQPNLFDMKAFEKPEPLFTPGNALYPTEQKWIDQTLRKLSFDYLGNRTEPYPERYVKPLQVIARTGRVDLDILARELEVRSPEALEGLKKVLSDLTYHNVIIPYPGGQGESILGMRDEEKRIRRDRYQELLERRKRAEGWVNRRPSSPDAPQAPLLSDTYRSAESQLLEEYSRNRVEFEPEGIAKRLSFLDLVGDPEKTLEAAKILNDEAMEKRNALDALTRTKTGKLKKGSVYTQQAFDLEKDAKELGRRASQFAKLREYQIATHRDASSHLRPGAWKMWDRSLPLEERGWASPARLDQWKKEEEREAAFRAQAGEPDPTPQAPKIESLPSTPQVPEKPPIPVEEPAPATPQIETAVVATAGPSRIAQDPQKWFRLFEGAVQSDQVDSDETARKYLDLTQEEYDELLHRYSHMTDEEMETWKAAQAALDAEPPHQTDPVIQQAERTAPSMAGTSRIAKDPDFWLRNLEEAFAHGAGNDAKAQKFMNLSRDEYHELINLYEKRAKAGTLPHQVEAAAEEAAQAAPEASHPLGNLVEVMEEGKSSQGAAGRLARAFTRKNKRAKPRISVTKNATSSPTTATAAPTTPAEVATTPAEVAVTAEPPLPSGSASAPEASEKALNDFMEALTGKGGTSMPSGRVNVAATPGVAESVAAPVEAEAAAVQAAQGSPGVAPPKVVAPSKAAVNPEAESIWEEINKSIKGLKPPATAEEEVLQKLRAYPGVASSLRAAATPASEVTAVAAPAAEAPLAPSVEDMVQSYIRSNKGALTSLKSQIAPAAETVVEGAAGAAPAVAEGAAKPLMKVLGMEPWLKALGETGMRGLRALPSLTKGAGGYALQGLKGAGRLLPGILELWMLWEAGQKGAEIGQELDEYGHGGLTGPARWWTDSEKEDRRNAMPTLEGGMAPGSVSTREGGNVHGIRTPALVQAVQKAMASANAAETAHKGTWESSLKSALQPSSATLSTMSPEELGSLMASSYRSGTREKQGLPTQDPTGPHGTWVEGKKVQADPRKMADQIQKLFGMR